MESAIKSVELPESEIIKSRTLCNERSAQEDFHSVGNENIDVAQSSKELETAHLKSILSKNLIKAELYKIKPHGCKALSIENKIALNKFPGFLHLAFDSLEKLSLASGSTISLNVIAGSIKIVSEQYKLNSFIKLRHYVKIPVLNRLHDRMKISVFVKEKIGVNERIAFDTSFVVNNEDLNKFHNKLVDRKLELNKRGSIFSSIKDMFHSGNNEEPICRFYCSFISNSEFKEASNTPNTLISLGKWIMFRKYAFQLLFEGYVNIKCEKDSFCWERRFIKWFGFVIYIFDIHTHELVQVVDLFDSEPSLEALERSMLIFNIEKKPFEIKFECYNSFKECTEATYNLFPRLIRWI
ncbi:hypothetical protein GINT2_002082 [Glugoides intestinalis]